jgi:hypothetical protein
MSIFILDLDFVKNGLSETSRRQGPLSWPVSVND